MIERITWSRVLSHHARIFLTNMHSFNIWWRLRCTYTCSFYCLLSRVASARSPRRVQLVSAAYRRKKGRFVEKIAWRGLCRDLWARAYTWHCNSCPQPFRVSLVFGCLWYIAWKTTSFSLSSSLFLSPFLYPLLDNVFLSPRSLI